MPQYHLISITVWHSNTLPELQHSRAPPCLNYSMAHHHSFSIIAWHTTILPQ
jgi:hypothetical protein